MAESKDKLKSLLMRMEEESEKVALQLSIKNLRSQHLVPSLPGKQKGKRKRGREVRSQEIGVNFFLCGFSDDTTLLAESKDKLKSLLMRVKKKSERAGLSLNIKKQTNKQLRSWHPAPLLHGK